MKKEEGIFVLISIILFFELIILAFKFPYENEYQLGIRITALVGFCALFVSVITSEFFEEKYEDGGKNLKTHHLFGGIGLILIILHPVLLAAYKSDWMVFMPRFDSWTVFWELAGRPALILIIIAFIAGFLRKIYKKSWRGLHGLHYIGLTFGMIHGILIGTDFQNPYIIVIFAIMYILSIYILVRKRVKEE